MLSFACTSVCLYPVLLFEGFSASSSSFLPVIPASASRNQAGSLPMDLGTPRDRVSSQSQSRWPYPYRIDQQWQEYLENTPIDLPLLKSMILNLSDDSFNVDFPEIITLIQRHQSDLRYQVAVNELVEILLFNNTVLTDICKRSKVTSQFKQSRRIFDVNKFYFGELISIAGSDMIIPSPSERIRKERCYQVGKTLSDIYQCHHCVTYDLSKMQKLRYFLLAEVMRNRLNCAVQHFQNIFNELHHAGDEGIRAKTYYLDDTSFLGISLLNENDQWNRLRLLRESMRTRASRETRHRRTKKTLKSNVATNAQFLPAPATRPLRSPHPPGVDALDGVMHLISD